MIFSSVSNYLSVFYFFFATSLFLFLHYRPPEHSALFLQQSFCFGGSVTKKVAGQSPTTHVWIQLSSIRSRRFLCNSLLIRSSSSCAAHPTVPAAPPRYKATLDVLLTRLLPYAAVRISFEWVLFVPAQYYFHWVTVSQSCLSPILQVHFNVYSDFSSDNNFTKWLKLISMQQFYFGRVILRETEPSTNPRLFSHL